MFVQGYTFAGNISISPHKNCIIQNKIRSKHQQCHISYQHNLVEMGHQRYVSNGMRCVGINNIYEFLIV